MAIMVHSQPSATSGMSSNAGANGNGFHTGEFLSVDDSWERAQEREQHGEYHVEGMSEDMVLLNHDVDMHLWGYQFSLNYASWNVSKETYTNSPFFTPQNKVVLQFKLHEIDSNGHEAFWLKVNDTWVFLDWLSAEHGYDHGESSDWTDPEGYSVSLKSRATEVNQHWKSSSDAEHLVTITLDSDKFSDSADLNIKFANTRSDNAWYERWGISALNMFEDNGGTDNGLASWASQGSNMRISKLSPDPDVNSLWNAIETEFDQTAATLVGMVDETKGNTYFNVGTAADDDISAAEIADAAYQIAGYLKSFFTDNGFGTLDDVAKEMWVSAKNADFINTEEDGISFAGRLFQYINFLSHASSADSWHTLLKGTLGDISAGLLHIDLVLAEDESNVLPDDVHTLGDELVQGIGNLIHEMKGTLSLHLQRAQWEQNQDDINMIQGGLDDLTEAADRFAEEYIEMSTQLSAMSILFDMFDGQESADRVNMAYDSKDSEWELADIIAFKELGYDVSISQQKPTGVSEYYRQVEVREGSEDHAKFDGIDGFDYKIGERYTWGERSFGNSYDFEFV